MNRQHSQLTDWGLTHIPIGQNDTILDVGCGGGRTVSKLAAAATQGKVYGLDYSHESVAASTRNNARSIASGHVQIRQESVSQLPFSDSMLDLVTAVETHYYWPDLPADLREILRVLKPGGVLVIIAGAYKGANSAMSRLAEKYVDRTSMTLLSADEHGALFENAGYQDVQVIENKSKGWICCIGRKP
jgi:ubiquinone/menaquinone biosynthesis C-methylase UbiE